MRRRVPVLGVAVLVAGLALFFVGVASAQEETPAPEETTAKSSQDEVSAQATRIKTFSNAIPIIIPFPGLAIATPYPSATNVSFRRLNRARIKDVNLTLLNYSHTWPDDVAVLLVGPNQVRKVVAMADVGGGGPIANVTLVLDDEAANSLPDSGPITGGSFKPTQGTAGVGGGGGNPRPANFPAPAPPSPYDSQLSTFDGARPNGSWQLYVIDDTNFDSGQFAGGWSLTIRARGR